jgi:hypothetical protein
MNFNINIWFEVYLKLYKTKFLNKKILEFISKFNSQNVQVKY